jgi:hypothetical protein
MKRFILVFCILVVSSTVLAQEICFCECPCIPDAGANADADSDTDIDTDADTDFDTDTVTNIVTVEPTASIEIIENVNTFDEVERITWVDSYGNPREADFAATHSGTRYDNIEGYITQLSYVGANQSGPTTYYENPSDLDRTTTGGFGAVVSHLDWKQPGYYGYNPIWPDTSIAAVSTKRDGFNFFQYPVFVGDHHTIFRTEYDMRTTLIERGDTDYTDNRHTHITIDWAFFAGVDHFIYAFTSAIPDYTGDGEIAFLNDLRAPYNVLINHPWPTGQSWGDRYQFWTYDLINCSSSPCFSPWEYEIENTIPYTWQFSDNGQDAENGMVQTESYAQKQAGHGFNLANNRQPWTGQPAYDDYMPEWGQNYFGFAYQMNYHEGHEGGKNTWGMPEGSIDGGFGSTPGYQNYSLAAHYGSYSQGGMAQLIAETESIHNGNVEVIGNLILEGPEGSGNPTVHTYSPAGYNHVYRTWELDGLGQVEFNVYSGFYRNPVFVVHGAQVSQIELNGVLLEEGVDCYISRSLGVSYVTLLQDFVGENVVVFR